MNAGQTIADYGHGLLRAQWQHPHGRFLGACLWVLGVAVASIPVSSGFAEVTWRATVTTMRCSEAAANIQAEFPFHNAGPASVRIVSIKPSCDCLVAAANQEIYAPGESGIIRAEFGLAGREGRQEKTVLVETDDSRGRPTVLTLIVDIPEPVIVRPRFVFWRLDEEPTEKAIEVAIAEPAHTTIGEVQCAEEAFSVHLQRLQQSGCYQVKIAPATTSRIAQATIRLNVVVEGKPRVYVLYAAVK